MDTRKEAAKGKRQRTASIENGAVRVEDVDLRAQT